MGLDATSQVELRLKRWGRSAIAPEVAAACLQGRGVERWGQKTVHFGCSIIIRGLYLRSFAVMEAVLTANLKSCCWAMTESEDISEVRYKSSSEDLPCKKRANQLRRGKPERPSVKTWI